MNITPEQKTRLVTLGRKLWRSLTEEEKGNYYFDIGTYGFVEKVADMLYITLGELTWTEFDTIHNEIIYRRRGRK